MSEQVLTIELTSKPAIAPGDVVRLKSGGPLMTVDSHNPADDDCGEEWWCVWMEGDRKCSAGFNPACLTAHESRLDAAPVTRSAYQLWVWRLKDSEYRWVMEGFYDTPFETEASTAQRHYRVVRCDSIPTATPAE